MARYVMESRTRAGAYLATLPFRNLQGEFFMSQPDQIRWEMPLHGTAITTTQFYPGITEIWIYRNDVLIFAGPCWNATASSSDNKFSCDAMSLESYLDQRTIKTDVSYSTTFGQMAWNLINTTQGLTDGALGITQGTLVPGGSPSGTVTYAAKEGKVISDAIGDLSAGDTGFDWEITPNRVFNEYYPRVSGNAKVRLEYKGNVTGYSVQVMGKYEANWIQVQGPDNSISSPVIDATKRVTYGLRDHVESNTALKSAAALQAYANQVLQLRREARVVPQISVQSTLVNPFNGDITIGQQAPLVIDDQWVQFNQNMRLGGFQLTVGRHGEETFVLYLNDLREIT